MFYILKHIPSKNRSILVNFCRNAIGIRAGVMPPPPTNPNKFHIMCAAICRRAASTYASADKTRVFIKNRKRIICRRENVCVHYVLFFLFYFWLVSVWNSEYSWWYDWCIRFPPNWKSQKRCEGRWSGKHYPYSM